MIVSVRLGGKPLTVGVRSFTVEKVSATDIFVEGRDHTGTIVVAARFDPAEARAFAEAILVALAVVRVR